MNIFEALRQSHDIQRQLCDQLIATQGASTEREQLFKTLTRELHAHARAEERYFYIPLMENDQGVDLSRHAIAEHHEMDELIEQVAAADPATASWLVYANCQKAFRKSASPLKRRGTTVFSNGRKNP